MGEIWILLVGGLFLCAIYFWVGYMVGCMKEAAQWSDLLLSKEMRRQFKEGESDEQE